MLQMLSSQALPTVALLFVAAVELEALVFVERPVVVWAAVLEALRLGAKESSALKNLAALALQQAALLVAAGLFPIVRAVLWAAVPVVQPVAALLAVVARSLVVQPLAVLAVFSVVAFVAPRSDAHQGR